MKTILFSFFILGIFGTQIYSLGSILGHTLGSKQIEKNVVIKITKPIPTTLAPVTTSPTGSTAAPTPTSTITTVPIKTNGSVLETGIGCGIIPLQPFEIVQIKSNNFGLGDYPNNDACIWKFTSTGCSISASCPCFDVPPSFDCLEDYLKILDLPYYHQKFCGSTVPNGIYRASTDVFSLKFRSNRRTTGKGFICYVQCTPPGYADQMIPNTTCPQGIHSLQ